MNAFPSAVIELDVHGMTLAQACTAIDAALRRRYAANAKVRRIELGLNQGETDLILREF